MCAITGNVETYNPATHRVEQRAAKEFAADPVKVESRQLDDILSNLARTNAEVSVLGSIPEHAKPAWLKVFERDPEYKEKLQAASYMTGLLPQLREAEKEGDLIRAAQLLGSYDAVSRWAENALSGEEANYMERLRRRLDKAGVEIIPSAVNKPFTGDTPELQATSTFHDDALFPGETIVAACTAAGVRRRVVGMDPVVTPAEVTVASHTVRNPELKYGGRTFTPTRVTVDREHGSVRIFTYDEPISGDSRQLGRELFPDLPDRKVYETEISIRAYDRMLRDAGWEYTANEEGRLIWVRPEAEKEVTDAIEKESRNPENKPSEPEAERAAEENTGEAERAPRETPETPQPAEPENAGAESPAEPRRSESPQPPGADEPPAEPAAPEKTTAVELKENDSVFIGGQEVPIMFINPDGSVEALSVLPINEKSVEDNGRYYTTFPSREALENAAEHRPDGSLRVIRDGKELLPESVQSPVPGQETSKAERPTQVPQEPGKYDRTVPQTREAQKTAISRVIDFARKVKDKIQRAVIAGITKRQSEDFAELGLDIDETWVHSFESSAYGHNQKHHGNSENEARRGQIAITEDDYARIPEILDSYDRVSKSTNKTKGVGNEVIIYEKEFDDGYIYYLEEKRDRRKSLAFHTMYKKKKGTDSSDGFAVESTAPITPVAPSDNLDSSSDRKVNTKSPDTQTRAEETAAKTSETPRLQERPEAEPTDPKGLRDAADRTQRDIDALEKQIESHRAKEPSRLSAGTSYEEKHAKWQQRMDELQDQLPPLRELVLKWRAKADRLEEEQRQAEEQRVIAEGGIPEDADGNWQFHKVTPEHTYRFLTERQGYASDDVIATADANTDAKEPKKPKLGANAKANAEKLQDYNRRLEEFNRNRGYWQQVREIAVRHKAEAEEAARLAEEEARKAAEAARAEEIRRQEEERRRAEEEAARRAAEKGVGREITDRWNGAEKIQGIEDAIITPSGRTIRGRYVLVEEGAATPSHDPVTGFAKSPGFPVDKNGNTVNDRDYERDKAAQQYVHRVAAGYDGRAVQDPVIVSRDGVVLSGNNRTMSGRIAARDNTDAGYIGHLETTAAKYGFTAEQVRSMKHPRLYFETGENLPYTAETFALFNKTEKKEMNVTERSVKLGKTISEGVFNRMAREMDAYETFAEYARSPEAVQAIKDLHAAGVIETAELPRYYDEQTGAITPEGVSLLQGALIGHVFNGNPDVVRMAMEHPAVRDSILKALVMLAENSRFSPEYSLIGDISRAIEIYHKGKEAGFRTVSESVLQHSLLEEMDIPETTALVIADLLNEGKTTRLQKFLKEYNAEARLADAGQLDIFSENAEPTPASEIRRQVYETLGINPKQYERYEKLRNNGKPDEPTDPDDNGPEPNGPQGGKPGGGGEPPQTPARPAGGTPQPGGPQPGDSADPRITLRQRDGETSYQISRHDVLEAAGRPRGMFDVAKTASQWHFGGLYDSDGRGSFLFPDSERAEAFLKAAEQYPGDPQAFEKAARELAERRDDGLFHKGEKYTVGQDNTTLEILSPRSLRGDYEVSVDGHKGIFKESQLQKILKPETDTPEASGPGHGSGSRPDLEAQGRRRDLAVEAKHARAKLRWNQKVLQQKEERLQKILDRDPAMVEIAEAFGDSMETMEAEARKEVRMASDEVEYARAQVEQREAELKAVRREIREGLKQLGIQEDRETDISKARQVFDRHNTDPENAALMQRAADLAQSVGVKLIFTDRLPDGAGGAYDRIGIVKLPVDFLTEDFGRRYSRNILHEVIHSVTVYALETPERDLPEGLRKGARALKEIYAELRDDPDFKGEYGSKTALEMTAELSNPLFRAKLKAKKLWHRVVDSVKTMLGLRPGSAYDAASRALEKLLDNFDADLWREYRDQIIRERGQNSGADRAPLNSAMTTNAEEFRRLQQRAVAERGVVMPGLADKEVRVVEVPRHPFTGEKPISQARRWAKGNIVGEHTLIDSSNREVPYTISGKAIEKYLSETAIGKSANIGVHLAVLTKLPEIIRESVEAEIHPDYRKNNNAKRTSENEINGDSLIHRFYGAVEVDGETFRVKTTIIENGVAQKNKPHSYEVTAVELIEDAVPQPDNHGRIGRPRFSETQHIVEDESSSGNSVSAAKLLKGIEKSYDSGKFLLEESEKASESPLVRFRDSGQLTEEYGPRWLSEQQQEDGRHSTQVANTIHSYQKFGDWVRRDSQGREVSVLDASSGLGLGTRHLNEMGITTEDVEPYPSAERPAPTFRSYADVDKQYDYIISNAVLNVLPEDWRRDVLRNMAVRLKPGGKMLINVRGAKGIINQGKEGHTRLTLDDPSEILVLRPDGSIRAYQKGFTKAELKEWVQKELGDAYEVEIANKENAGSTYDTAVLVRRKAEPAAPERNLVAVHNLTEENLADALGLGGFPMPSVAVTKAGMEHKDYGPVSLVFGRESIDPARRGNKVYSGDAWTPVFPETGYKLNGKKTNEIYGRANGAGALPLFKPTDFHPDNYERRIDRRGDRSLIELFRDSYSAKQLFLSEKGNPVTETVQTQVEKYTPGRITLLEDIVRTIGVERLLSESDDVLAPEVRGLVEKHDPSALEGKKPFVVKAKINNAILEAVDYAENGNIAVKADTDATRAEIDKRVNQKEFETWLSDMFSGVVEKKGIRNERDPFTPSGSSRPWEALYDEITLDNVVRAMRRQADKGGQGFFGSSIFGASTRELRDIDDVRREAAARISSVPREEYEAEKKQIVERLSKVTLPSVAGDFSRAMDFVENVNEAVAKSHTADGIYRHLKGIYPDMTRAVAEEIGGIVADIQKMATRYLEAKPRRGVGLGEVRLAVVPEGTAPELVRQLESRGIPVRTYEPGNERQRADIISRETADRGLRFRRQTAEVQKRDSGTVPTPREARAATPILSLAVRDTRARLDAAADPQERRELQEQLDQLLEEQDAYATGRAPQTPAQRAGVRRAAETTAAALGEKVIIHTTAAGITHPDAAVRARMRRAKGWYDAATGEVHINAFNHATEADVARTLLHESIGHKALRDFYGERFDSFLDEIYSSAEESIRRQIASRMGNNGWNVREATEEYMAGLAETVDRHGAEHLDTAARRTWQRTKTAVKRTLNRILEKAGLTTRVNLTDRDLSYILWRQYRSRRKAGALEAAENRVRLEALKADPESFAPELSIEFRDGQSIDVSELKRAQIAKLRNSEPVTVTEDMIPRSVDLNDRKAVKTALKESVRGEVTNQDTNNVISVYKDGINEVTAHGMKVPAHVKSLFAIPEMLRKSIFIGEKSNEKDHTDFDKYQYYVCGMKIDGEDYTAKIVVGVKGENRYYDHRLTQIEKGKLLDSLNGLSDSETVKEAPFNGRKGTTLESLLQVSDSKNIEYRFRDGDREAAADPATAEETRSRRIFDLMVDMCNRNKDNVEYRDAARKTLTGRLATVARGMRLQRDFDRAQLAAVTDTCNKMIGLEILDTDSRADMARTIKAIDGSAGKEDLEDTAYRLLGIASHSQVRMARRRLDDLSKIRGTKTGDDRIQRQAGLDPEGQATAKAFRDFRKLPEQNIQTAMARVSERIAGDDVPESASMLAAAEMLGLRQALLHSQEDALHRDNLAGIEDALRDLKNQWDPSLSGEERRRYRQAKKSLGQQRIVEELRHADALGAIADSMGDTLQASKERVRIFREAEKERVNNIHHDANCDMQGRPAHADRPARSKLVNNTVTSFFLAPTMTFDQMLRMFGKHSANGEGYLYYRFMSGPQGWQACEDRRFKSKQAKERILDRKAAEILGKDKAHWADLYKLTRAEGCTLTYNSAGVEVERKVSQGNLMYIYMANKMTDGAVKLRHMNITEEDMDLVEEVLDPRLRQLADWIQDEFLPSTRDGYNDVHIRMFGAPMDYVENYFPLKITEGEIQKNVEIGEMMNDGEGDTPKILTGAIRKRVFNTRALNILDSDPVAITLEHLEEMEDWAAFSEFRRDLGTLLSYRRFKNQVKNTTSLYGAGEKLWKRFGETAQLVGGADQGMRSGMVGEVDKAVVNLCKLGTASRITYRVFTALKQFTSLPAFGSDTNLWNAIHSTATPRASWQWCMENMPSFEKRWVTRQAGIKRFQR